MILHHHNTTDAFHIDTGSTIFLIDEFFQHQGKKEILCTSGSHLTYLVIISGNSDIQIHCTTAGEGSHIDIVCVCIGEPHSTLKANINVRLEHPGSHANIQIVTFACSHSSCSIDGGIYLDHDAPHSEGYLMEETYVLGDPVHITTLPTLDVHANEVKASHGATIQRLDPEKKFYLASKGITDLEGTRLMISGALERMFSSFNHEPFYQALQEHYLERILSHL